ncbi:hypothetical protein B0T19DRAFT_9712 [Cercophora scortea]|uniref:Uncharacterized protein n=1 Tax=Cercophora scortea TaxID=314031 RepID=A0AAE0MK22_9PEZI|nr:hypothetical protein B0T19DRAFT_9712 [Cercophora scortea]
MGEYATHTYTQHDTTIRQDVTTGETNGVQIVNAIYNAITSYRTESRARKEYTNKRQEGRRDKNKAHGSQSVPMAPLPKSNMREFPLPNPFLLTIHPYRYQTISTPFTPQVCARLCIRRNDRTTSSPSQHPNIPHPRIQMQSIKAPSLVFSVFVLLFSKIVLCFSLSFSQQTHKQTRHEKFLF